MKVLHVIPSVSPSLGGPTQVVLNLVKALRECSIEAEIVTTNDNGTSLLDVPLYQKIEYEQVPVWFLPRFSPPLKEYIFSPAITKWLWQNIKNYDILDNHYLFSYASTCAGAIARWQKIPYTVRTMGQLSPWALAQSQRKKQIYSLLIERHNLNRATAIHCTSEGEAADVRNFGIKTPTVTLPLGVNQPEPFSNAQQKIREIYQISSSIPIVLFLSRLHYKKRPDLLIRSLKKLAFNQAKFHLILAGTGEPEYLQYLQNLVLDNGLTTQTTFAGFVTGKDKDLLLQGSDLFVLPSFSENFGIAVAEALAHGLPVIITPDIQIAPEISLANAGLIIPGEEEAIANAIAQLLDNPEQRYQLSENGKKLVKQRYSWNAIASQLTEVYRTIIDRQTLPDLIKLS
ncbi:group 1 glycosyl transferase [[Phormidium ambiguum] IAM M-71]|uniref:Group 1 glycosyl transferase n=1 Tax=[Phormidium ambiguum] IAM M-71 TaxID=454136 RepID=A0A1U7ISJ1_9CYAN|nr:glycosyltransferase [Phormidium ambiguum]OKH40418.1 group 1 glycosyl transferase [Phormidium ambiguum IAM M-71]